MPTALVTRNLRKHYGPLIAVDDVSFEVATGEIFGVLGPNGAGKTTIVECLQGLRRSDGGEISVLGLDPRVERRALRQRIGSQLQESALPDRIKVWEALDLFGAAATDAADRTTLLREWGLADKQNARFADLSGGQRQRLFVALALVNRPDLVFLDEMTTGLDPAARREAWQLIEAIRERGTTVVLVTHFMDEAERLCDRLAIIDAGRVAAIDTPEGLIKRVNGEQRLRFRPSGEFPDQVATSLPGVTGLARDGDHVVVTGTGDIVAAVVTAMSEAGVVPHDLRVEQANVEDAFVALTGRQFDAEPSRS